MNTAQTPNNTTPRATRPKRSIAAAIIGAGAVAIGALVATAPLAHAIPESTIKSECDDAGGVYTTGTNDKGQRVSSCTYTDNTGNVYVDAYTNGKYTGTYNSVRGGPSTSAPRPTNLPPVAVETAHPAAPGAAP